MKKLILSMFIVLGTIASVQAQSFNFYCDTSNDNTFETVEEGFSADQIAIFIFNGFDQVTIRSGNGFRRPEVDSYGNSFTFSVQFGEYRKIAAADDPQESGLYPYRTLGAQGRQSFYDTAAEVMADLALLDPNSDDDNDGFTLIEEDQVLSESNGNTGLALFEANNGNYQLISNPSIIIESNRNGTFDVINENADTDIGEVEDIATGVSLQEAIDAALATRS